MLKFFLANKDGKLLNVQVGLDDEQTLISEGIRTLAAHWKSSKITTATTTNLIEVAPNESILLTDLIVTLEKKVATATIIPRFSDGANTENLFTFEAATAAFQFSHAFQGGLRGWKDADFQVVTNEATTVSVLVGYVHITPEATKPYDVWSAER